MIRTTDGDYLLGGISYSMIGGEVSERNRSELSGAEVTGSDYWIVKIGGRTGHKLWDKRFGGRSGEGEEGANDELSAVLQIPGGDYLLAGYSETAKGFEKSEDSRGKTDYWVVRATPQTATVSSFTLINADRDEAIGEIKDGDVINLAALPTMHLNIRANTGPARVGSLLFNLRGQQTRNHVENGAPYALFGNDEQDYFPWTPELETGDYALTATPYSTSAARGEKGTPRTIHFRVILQVVNRFTLVNADTDEDIIEIKEGDVININALPTTHLNVRANTDPATVGSVLFSLRGPQRRDHIENSAPYALFGNNGQDYLPWTPEPATGDYTLTATPYSAAAAGGEKGRAYRVAFSLVRSTPDAVNLVLEHRADIPGGTAALRKGEAGAGVESEMNDASAGPRLYPSYPNPFRAATTIAFRLVKESRVQLAVLDKHGLPVNHLLDQVMPAGEHKAHWQPRHLPSGVYVVQLRADDVVKVQRIVLIR
jgi:hypothetical protein